jgi:hypothetical protein
LRRLRQRLRMMRNSFVTSATNGTRTVFKLRRSKTNLARRRATERYFPACAGNSVLSGKHVVDQGELARRQDKSNPAEPGEESALRVDVVARFLSCSGFLFDRRTRFGRGLERCPLRHSRCIPRPLGRGPLRMERSPPRSTSGTRIVCRLAAPPRSWSCSFELRPSLLLMRVNE